MKKHIVFAFCVLLSRLAIAQLPTSTTATLPPSIKWQQINSPHFKIIYTESNEAQAQKVANILERIYIPASNTLGVRPRKFPIVIQNERSESNGFVTVGPFRSELFATAPQHYLRTGNDYWLERLASHEYRHIVQFEKAVTPFNQIMYFLMGEFGAGFWATMAAPSWFYEGDAVGLETAVGRTGRGDMPSFLMPFKANLLEKGGFHYYKQHLGSFKDFVPNHYVTGYLITTHLKNKFGPHVWDKISERAFSYPYIPGVFSSSIKRYTGEYLLPTYQDMLDHQLELYTDQVSQIQPSPFQVISTEPRKIYTDYAYPQVLSDGSVVALKYGMGDIRKLVLLHPDGDEELLHEVGLFNDIGYLSANDSSVVWTELEPDLRWRSRSYLTIRKFDLKNRKLSRIGRKTRYTAVSVSSDNQQLVVTEQDIYGHTYLKILGAEDGEILREYPNPDSLLYTMPYFDSTGKYILSLIHQGEGKAIIRKEISTGLEEEIYFTEEANLGAPVEHEGFVYFNSNYNGIDNIFRVSVDGKAVEQATNAKYGAFNADLSKGQMYYMNYTVDGHNIVASRLDELDFEPIEEVKDLTIDFAQKMVHQEDIKDVLYQPDSIEYETKKYSKVLNSIRPISWTLSQAEEANTSELSVVSRDILGTSVVSVGGRYNDAENTLRGFVDYSYQALYPVINLSASWGKRYSELDSTLVIGLDSIDFAEWNENEIELGISLPLQLTKSRMLSGLNLGVSSSVSKISGLIEQVDTTRRRGNGLLYTLNGTISWSRFRKRNRLDVQSRWGQSLSLFARATPYGGDYKSTLFAAETRFNLPGFFRHHGIRLQQSYQYERKDNYRFSSPVTYTTGYNYFPFDHYFNAQVRYGLPLAYMDWFVGPWFNLQRIRANVLYDHGLGWLNSSGQRYLDNDNVSVGEYDFKSTSVDIMLNFNVFRYRLLIDAGLRSTYRIDTKDWVFQVIFAGASF